MKVKKKHLRGEEGFTLIEIIAVLIVLGVLAAVAVPKYMDLQGDAKEKAATGQVAELKGTLQTAWAKKFMADGSNPAASAVVTESGFTSVTAEDIGSAPDIWNVELTASSTSVVNIEVNNRNSDTGYNATGTWIRPETE